MGLDLEPQLEIRVGSRGYPVLDAYRRSDGRVDVIRGPLGSGKTFASVQRILRHTIRQAPNEEGIRPTRWMAIRNFNKDLQNTTVPDFLKVFGRLGTMTWTPPAAFNMRVRLLDGTIAEMETIFLALDTIDDVADLRGYQLTGAWLNETKELVKAIIDMVEYRCGRYPDMAGNGVRPTWHGWFGDTNSWDDDHYLHRIFEEERPPGWTQFVQPGGVVRDPDTGLWVANHDAENLRNLPDGYYVNGLGGKSPDWIKVNLANEIGFALDGKPVHPAYIDSLHCARQPIPFDPRKPILLGIDYGRTPAAAIGQYDEAMARLVIIDEYVTEDMSAADFGPALRRYLDANYPQAVKGWSDPAGDSPGQATNDTPRQVLIASGVPVQPAPTNEPVLRRAAVSRPLQRLCMDGKPALLISPKAKTLRRGLAGGFCYRRLKVSGDEKFTDQPDKNRFSHVCEGLEYLELGLGEGMAAIRRADISREPMQTVAEM